MKSSNWKEARRRMSWNWAAAAAETAAKRVEKSNWAAALHPTMTRWRHWQMEGRKRSVATAERREWNRLRLKLG